MRRLAYVEDEEPPRRLGNMIGAEVTEQDRDVVRLLAEGYARWAVAVKLDLSEERVRAIVRKLCEIHKCPAIDLPRELGIPMLGDGDDDDDDGRVRVDGSVPTV